VAVDLARALLVVVGLGPGVAVSGVAGRRGGRIEIGVELTGRACCGGWGGKVWAHGSSRVVLADLPALGRPVRLRWGKRRWRCPEGSCSMATFTDRHDVIALPRARMTTRAAKHATRRAGLGRAIGEIAAELGCGWHAAMAAVHRWGRALLDADRGRLIGVTALGLDEILMFRRGRYREKHWGATVVDARRGRLLDIVPGRSASGAKRWLGARPPRWRRRIRWAVMDLSGPYRKTAREALPQATQVADPFHVVKLANSTIDDVRRRVHNDTTGGRGTKGDALYRTRRRLLRAAERVSDRGRTKLVGLLAAGDPRGEVRDAWHTKQTLRGIYQIPDRDLALEALDELSRDLRDETYSAELNKLGRTLNAWRTQITNWHRSRVTNGPTEAVNNLAKLIKRVSFGTANFDHYRTRVLLYAAKPDWSLLDDLTPRQNAKSLSGASGRIDRRRYVGPIERAVVGASRSSWRLTGWKTAKRSVPKGQFRTQCNSDRGSLCDTGWAFHCRRRHREVVRAGFKSTSLPRCRGRCVHRSWKRESEPRGAGGPSSSRTGTVVHLPRSPNPTPIRRVAYRPLPSYGALEPLASPQETSGPSEVVKRDLQGEWQGHLRT